MRIALRADASATIGTGHIRRCLTLAEALRQAGAEVVFLTRRLGVDSAGLIRAAGIETLELGAPQRAFSVAPENPAHAAWAGIGWREDAAQSISVLGGWQPDIVLLDHYAFDARWLDAVRTACRSAMVAIDDLGDRPLSADVIVDHNYSDDFARKHRVSERYRPRILGGPAYALLSQAYRTRGEFVVRDRVESVGVFMGGSDIANATEIACTAARHALGPDVIVEIVGTSANPHLDRLRRLADEDSKMILSLDLPDLAAFFARHDLQIGAGGGATWERCCIGAPTIAVAYADNHVPVLRPLDRLGILRFSAQGTQDAAALVADIREVAGGRDLRAAMSRKARKAVDGRGARRVAEAVLQLHEDVR